MSTFEPDKKSLAGGEQACDPASWTVPDLSRSGTMPDTAVVDVAALSTAPVVDYAAFVIRQWNFRVEIDREDNTMLRVTPRPTEDFEAFVEELQYVLQNYPFDGHLGRFTLEPVTEGPRFRHHVCVHYRVDAHNSDLQLVLRGLTVAKVWLEQEGIKFEEQLNGCSYPQLSLHLEDAYLKRICSTFPKIVVMKDGQVQVLESWEDVERFAPRESLPPVAETGHGALLTALQQRTQDCPIRGYVALDKPDGPNAHENEAVIVAFIGGDPREERIKTFA